MVPQGTHPPCPHTPMWTHPHSAYIPYGHTALWCTHPWCTQPYGAHTPMAYIHPMYPHTIWYTPPHGAHTLMVHTIRYTHKPHGTHNQRAHLPVVYLPHCTHSSMVHITPVVHIHRAGLICCENEGCFPAGYERGSWAGVRTKSFIPWQICVFPKQSLWRGWGSLES